MVFKISKPNVNVESAENKDLVITSELDTFKIYKTGTLTLSLSNNTVSPGNTETFSATFAHGLGYIPMATPLVYQRSTIEVLPGVPGGFIEPQASSWVVNDESQFSSIGSSGPGHSYEAADVTIDATNLTLKVYQICGGASPDTLTFLSHTVSVYYTIFYNRLDEEFDLL